MNGTGLTNTTQPATFDHRTETAPPQAPDHELVPVPASIFDDDFFLRGRRRSDPEPASTDYSREPQLRTDVRVPTFGGLAPASEPDPHEDDELDIPAFLRRGNH